MVSPEVKLKPGSRISFHGSSLPENFRLIRMTAYSEAAEDTRLNPADWLLHVDPEAEISEEGNRVVVRLGDACLDFFVLPSMNIQEGVSWEIWPVKEPHERFRQTKRIFTSPRFSGGEAQVITALHARAKEAPAIQSFEMSTEGKKLMVVDFEIGDKTITVKWDLENKSVKLVEM